MTLTPIQQQAVEAVRAMDAAVADREAAWDDDAGFTDARYTEKRNIARDARDAANKASIAAIRELADNEGGRNAH